MNPQFIDRDSFSVVGVSRKVAPAEQNEETFRLIWNEFEARYKEVKTDSIDGHFYGIRFATDETGTEEYVAAMAVESDAAVPQGLVIYKVPAARYAVFECPVRSIGVTYRRVFTEWLPTSSLELDQAAPVFEQYPPADEEAATVQIHVPLKGAT